MRSSRRIELARRVLLYNFGLTSILVAIVGTLTMAEDWVYGLALVVTATSGMAVCGGAIRENLADDLRSLFRRRHRGRHA